MTQLTLRAGRSVACAFEGLDNVNLVDIRHVLKQNYSESQKSSDAGPEECVDRAIFLKSVEVKSSESVKKRLKPVS